MDTSDTGSCSGDQNACFGDSHTTGQDMAQRVSAIEEICRRFFENYFDPNFVGPISNKLRLGLVIPVNENVFLAWDDSWWNDGTVGFAVTERGLYVRNRFKSGRFIPYEAVKSAPVIKDKADIYIGSDHVAVYFNGRYEDALVKLVELYSDIVKALYS